MKTDIVYLKGDATEPIGSGKKVLAHITNNKGAWGSGFVLAVTEKWEEPEANYRSHVPMLGAVNFVKVGVKNDMVVANMCAQNGFPSKIKPVAVDYNALRCCLSIVAPFCRYHNAKMVAPRIGCGIGGSTWDKIEPIINDEVCSRGVEVEIYDFVPKS